MSRTALEVKATRKPKFSTRGYNRCPICPEFANQAGNQQ